MNENKTCSICLESYINAQISYCTNCNDSGNTCHNCELLWVKQGNNPNICIICRNSSKKNISEEALNENARYSLYLISNHIITETRDARIARRIENRRAIRLRLINQNQRELTCVICIVCGVLVFIIFIGLIVNVFLMIDEKKE